MALTGTIHRAGALKQTNKLHKTKHSSKREIDAANKGKCWKLVSGKSY
jgi:hypothetical protein